MTEIKELKKEIHGLKAAIKMAEADKEIFRHTLRSHGFVIFEGSSNNINKCNCTPIHKYVKVQSKYKEFYPKEGCYSCSKCGARNFCDKCIENYELTVKTQNNK